MIHWPSAGFSHIATWSIAAAATAAVIVRPARWPGAVWAVGGALALLLCGLISMSTALQAVAEGWDVYLFLTGMLLLALKAMARQLQEANARMQRLAIEDGLTGAFNRRHFDDEIGRAHV